MSLRRTRAIAYGVVALFGVAAVYLTKPLPPRDARPGDVLTRQDVGPRWRVRHDTLGRGDNLMALLARAGLGRAIAREALEAVKVSKALDFRYLPANMQVTLRSAVADTLPSEIVLKLAVDRLLHVKRSDSTWVASEERLPWTTDTVVLSGTIDQNRSNLYLAMYGATDGMMPRYAANKVVTILAEEIYEYRVDMSRDLRVGDAFTVVAQRRIGPDSSIRIDTVIGATMKLSGNLVEAVRFRSNTGGLWFDQQGRPLRSGFLRSPLLFSRITSRFGMRRHPILGSMRQHQGTDYGASSGTPIRAIGDGVVVRANYNNGYGNVVEIRHPNGYVSRYAHMSRFGKGISRGVRVSREQTIGYVGSTGLSTAPHLHFEVIVGGVQRNPSQVLANVSALPLPKSELTQFTNVRSSFLSMLQTPRYLAQADVRQAGAPSSAQ
jgi:murein DD-endopeptidase MepM/ murein hydrolase activator NlpD